MNIRKVFKFRRVERRFWIIPTITLFNFNTHIGEFTWYLIFSWLDFQFNIVALGFKRKNDGKYK